MNFRISRVKTLSSDTAQLYIDIEIYNDAGKLVHHNDFIMQIPRQKLVYIGPVLGPEEQPDPADYETQERTRAEIRAEVVGNVRRYIQRLKARVNRGDHVRFDDRTPMTVEDSDPDGLVADIIGLAGQDIAE